MLELSGVDLARKVIAKYLQSSIILMTAFDTSEIEEEAKNIGIPKIIYRNLDFKQVRRTIYEWMIQTPIAS